MGSDARLHRDDWFNKVDEIFRAKHLGTGRYKKNDEQIFEHINTYNGVTNAIGNAKRRMSDYCVGKIEPSKYDPGVTLHILVEELLSYL